MFHKAMKSLAEQLDPGGDLIPVRCLLDQDHFRPLCLVQKNCRGPWWQKQYYYKTDYKLCDVLWPGQHASQPGDLQGSDLLTEMFTDICDSDAYTIEADRMLKGGVTVVPDLATAGISGSASMSSTRSVTMKKRYIGAQVLDFINGKSKINLDHPLIKQCDQFQRDIYVISETVETVEATEFTDSSKIEGSILAEVYLKLKFTGLRDIKNTVTIPKGSTLAFRVKRLIIRNGTLSITNFPHDKRQTFAHGAILHKVRKINPRVWRWFFISVECTSFSSLSIDLCGKFLNGFLAIIRNNDLLQELELKLEQGLYGINPIKLKTSRPELQELVNNLQDSTGLICHRIAGSVLYFLQTLEELSESELWLLEESVERKIVPKQTALVKCILEKDDNDETGELIKIQEVPPFTEDELDITVAMIKLRGMTVDRSITGLLVTGNRDAYMALCALYFALYVLNVLSK